MKHKERRAKEVENLSFVKGEYNGRKRGNCMSVNSKFTEYACDLARRVWESVDNGQVYYTVGVYGK